MTEPAGNRVIVVGAGPVGLGAALELARFGVPTVVLEKHPTTSWHPKTRNLNTRTMEIARGWGAPVYEQLRSIDTPPGWKSPIRFLRTAVGEQVGMIESKGFEGPGPDVSPAEPIMSSQELVEEILLDAARATGLVDVRFSTEVTALLAGGAPDDHAPDVFTPERAHAWIRAAVGVDDLDPEVLSIGFWKLNATVAERLVQGRVVVCGDAAHQFPPTGGLGVNTGLQGMHNAMWKLAFHVQGRAGWPLVETYDTERRPVAEEIARQSLENSINVVRINRAAAAGTDSGLSTEAIVTESRRYGNHLGVELGAAYSSPAVVPDGTAPPPVDDSYSDYAPSATPGCRAPHVWVHSSGAPLSTLDLIGTGFTLLAASPGGWRAAAAAAADELGVTIDCHEIGGAGLHDRDAFDDAYGLEAGGAVLVRPDGHVGWRQARGPADGGSLTGALRTILAR